MCVSEGGDAGVREDGGKVEQEGGEREKKRIGQRRLISRRDD